MKKWFWLLAVAGIGVVCATLMWNHSCPQDAVWLEAYDTPEGAVLQLAETEGTPDVTTQLETLAALGFAPSNEEAAAFHDYIFSQRSWPMETLEPLLVVLYRSWLLLCAGGRI